MAKSKGPSPQELYRQRKEREEQERTAYLPPGLINHGNTCFMNSVLQGLIATRLLSDLVHFSPIPAEIQHTAVTPIMSRRSPQLTNGHNLAGPYERPWINTMPIGDVFLTVMYKAWDGQAKRRRESLSPKSILNALGQKYDQYLDFAQQDAHEFLRILLDAMRMEEQDIIKKRQPPPPHQKKRRRTTITSADASTKTSDKVEEPGLLSFADMIFGGQLTSILVCQKCKHVSQTYEDFNDISLSIKPEDYYSHKKRDRFKKMVGRLTMFPGSSSNKHTHVPIPANQILEMQRASSVPPSPRTERDVELPVVDGPRRRSLDVETKEGSESAPDSPEPPSQLPAKEEENESSDIAVNITVPEEKHIEFVEQKDKRERQESTQSALESGSEKEGSKDSWAKIGRRISLSVGLGRSRAHDKEKEKDKEKKEKDRKSRSMDRGGLGGFIKEVVAEVDLGIQKSLSVNSAISSSQSDLQKREKTGISSDANLRTPSPGPSDSAQGTSGAASSISKHSSKPLPPPPQPAASSTPPKPPSSSPNFLNPTHTASSIFPVQRSKSPKPPKPSHAETEYLRRILADVATAPPSNPFAIFKPPLLHTHSSHHGSRPAFTSYNHTTTSSSNVIGGEKTTWMGIGIRNLSGIEECLRMFTAVEVLDGENMVGCRRCWKIQNGQLPTSKDSDQDDEEEEVYPPKDHPTGTDAFEASIKGVDTLIRPPLRVIPPSLSSGTAAHIPTSISTPTVSFYSHEDDNASDTRSVSSLPEPTSPSLASFDSVEGSNTASSSSSMLEITSSTSISDAAGPGGLPIPVISTTAPESPPASSPEFCSTLLSTVSQIDGNRESAHSRLIDNQNGTPPSVPSDGPSPHPRLTQALYGYTSSSKSKESLVIPKIGRNGLQRRPYADTNTEYESSGDDSDTSVGTSVSADSAFSSQQTLPSSKSQPQSNGIQSTTNSIASSSKVQTVSASASAPQKKTPKPPKPTIMRPAYKRYLIAVPPPILVIHLKRFQQTSKTPLISFSHGFKKLDDYISFPEYLDLMPFLAPKKEDYGLGKKGRDKEKKSDIKEDRCMYRLYAVVVHIGNMLGGHYIAYTALPSPPSNTPASGPTDDSGASALSTSTSIETNEEKDHTDSQTTSKSTERQWAYISDTVVRLTTLEEVLHAKAYMCMYERC